MKKQINKKRKLLKKVRGDLRVALELIERELKSDDIYRGAVWIAEGDTLDALKGLRDFLKLDEKNV